MSLQDDESGTEGVVTGAAAQLGLRATVRAG